MAACRRGQQWIQKRLNYLTQVECSLLSLRQMVYVASPFELRWKKGDRTGGWITKDNRALALTIHARLSNFIGIIRTRL